MTGNLNVFAPAALEAESRGVGGIVHFEIVSSVSTSSGLGFYPLSMPYPRINTHFFFFVDFLSHLYLIFVCFCVSTQKAPKNINKVVKVTENVVGDLKIGMKQIMKSEKIKYQEREEW